MRTAALPNGALAVGAFLAPCLLCVPRDTVATVALLLIAAIATLWISQYKPLAERYLRQHPRHRVALIIGCSFLFAALAIGPNVFAKWWVMDDHELAVMLGSDHQITLPETIDRLAEHPEVGAIGSRSRVRPAYYVLRYAETWLWGENLFAWYAARVIALGSVVSLCLYLLWRWLGAVDSAIMLLVMSCFRVWADLWSRIGSSETYAMVGIAIAVGGGLILEQLHAKKQSKLIAVIGWSGITLGSAVAMGSKENFLVMVPAVMLYAATLAWRSKLDKLAIAGTSLVTLMGLFLAMKITGTLAADGGVDIYAKQRSGKTLLLATIRCMTAHLGAPMLIAIIGMIVWARCANKRERFRSLATHLYRTAIVMAGLLALYVSQFAFYDGASSLNSRYAFPGLLAPFLAVPLLVQSWLKYRRVAGDDRTAIRRTELQMRFGLVTLVCILGIGMLQRSTKHVHNTALFTGELEKLVQQCTSEPDRPLLFVCHKPKDFECLYSVEEFLRFYHVTNPVFLKVDASSLDWQSNELDRSLFSRLVTASEKGDVSFDPLQELSDDQLPLRVGFSVPQDRAAYIGNFPCWR